MVLTRLSVVKYVIIIMAYILVCPATGHRSQHQIVTIQDYAIP